MTKKVRSNASPISTVFPPRRSGQLPGRGDGASLNLVAIRARAAGTRPPRGRPGIVAFPLLTELQLDLMELDYGNEDIPFQRRVFLASRKPSQTIPHPLRRLGPSLSRAWRADQSARLRLSVKGRSTATLGLGREPGQ